MGARTVSSPDSAILEKSLTVAQRLLDEHCARQPAGLCDCTSVTELYAQAVLELSAASAEPLSVDSFDSLSRAYENLLCYAVQAKSGTTCKLELIERNKKRRGSFYTPRNLSAFAVEKALERLIFDANSQIVEPSKILGLKVIDPAMGSGVFLSAALDYLAGKLLLSRQHYFSASHDAPNLVACKIEVARSCLFGVDLDPGAVQVARRLIALQSGGGVDVEKALKSHFLCGNALVGALPRSAFVGNTVEQCDALCNNFFATNVDGNLFNYFHWEFRFPDVFTGSNPGFDAVIGNPPWEIAKPNSREFFHQKVADYWKLGKQDALKKQRELLTNSSVKAEWQCYQDEYKRLGAWVSKSGAFKHQTSSDINAYKLFVELSMLIGKSGASVSLIVPSSIYSDKGTAGLRNVLLLRNHWTHLYTFQNTLGIFDIHRSFKFCLLAFILNVRGDALCVSFDNASVNEAVCKNEMRLLVDSLSIVSPKWLAVPEFECMEDFRLLVKISQQSITFGEFAIQNNVQFCREYDMTNDSHKFLLREEAEGQGFTEDQFGRWVKDNQMALPLYEGRMIGHFDVAQKGWVSGKGRQAVWLSVPDGKIMPQYLLPHDLYENSSETLKVGFLGVGCSTNSRSMIAACLGDYPCGNSVGTFSCPDDRTALLLTALLNSFVFDYVLRMRLVGNNLNYFILQDCYLPQSDRLVDDWAILAITAELNFNPKHQAPQLKSFARNLEGVDRKRTHLKAVLDALVADLYQLDLDDLKWILRDCDRPKSSGRRARADEKLNARGFWRVDKNLPPADRQTILTLKEFESLKSLGRPKYLDQIGLYRGSSSSANI